MKRISVLVLACGCASGRAPNATNDAPDQLDGSLASKDANETFFDAPMMHPDAAIDAAMPDACVPVAVEKLLNPALDLAPMGTNWTQVLIPNVPGGPYPVITNAGPFAPHSAPNKAWFGGVAAGDAGANNVTDQAFQDFAVPANATMIVVSGFFATGTQESGGTVFDTFSLDITQTNGTPIESILTLDNTVVQNTFAQFSHTVSAGGLAQMVGKTVRLRGTSTNDIINASNFFIDTLSVSAVACP